MNRITILLALILCASCTKVDNEITPPPAGDQPRAIIVAEGQFGYGTGSLTTLSAQGIVTQDVFRNTNKRPLGDVPQSLTQIGDYYYIPVNNSRKIEVVDAKTFNSVETMKMESSVYDIPKVIPMYVAHLGADSIAVTDQSSSAIPGSSRFSSLLIVDINHNTTRDIVRRAVRLPFPTFQMKTAHNKLFISGAEFSVFDINNISTEGRRAIKNQNGATFPLCDFSKICSDKTGKLWVLTPSSVVCVDPVSEQIIHDIELGLISSRWGNCDIDAEGRYFYFNASNKVYMIDTQNPTKPTSPIITHNNNDEHWTTYSMGVSKENTIFIVRVLFGSITRGRVFEYDTQGTIAKEYIDQDGNKQNYFKAGIFPHYIHFL